MNKEKYLIDEDGEVFDYKTIENAEEMLELIETWHEQIPKNTRTKAYKDWQKDLILMHKHYNTIVGFNALKTRL